MAERGMWDECPYDVLRLPTYLLGLLLSRDRKTDAQSVAGMMQRPRVVAARSEASICYVSHTFHSVRKPANGVQTAISGFGNHCICTPLLDTALGMGIRSRTDCKQLLPLLAAPCDRRSNRYETVFMAEASGSPCADHHAAQMLTLHFIRVTSC
jgi:hypothetical protein